MTEPIVNEQRAGATTVLTPSPGCPPPHPAPRAPRIALPVGSCDAHCHVFGPSEVFPYAPDRTFTPFDAPRDQLVSLHAHLGLQRAVVVQASCYGFDHSVLIDALSAERDRMRGVALIGPETTRNEIERLHHAGVRAFRLNYLAHLRTPPTRDEIDSILRRTDGLGWGVELHVSGREIVDLEQVISSLPGRVVIDHLARVDLAEGPDGPAVRSLRRLLDSGSVWLKVSGVDRISRTDPPYADAVDLAASFVAYAPERVMWGTDYPHVNIQGDAPDDGLLVDLLGQIAPDRGHLTRLLVENPEEFYDFPRSAHLEEQ